MKSVFSHTLVIFLMGFLAVIQTGGRVKEVSEVNEKSISTRKPNRLIKEKSPYLLQHAYNPVDWYPWGEEAFAKAKQENKPIFLSIGYSTCHWCHVMERESFENAEIARLMNERFVNIKVDREERPDIDRVYMAFVQATTGSGGWPMSVWLTPDLKPFYGGTYFPPDARYGRPGFPDLIQRIGELWKTEREKILRSSDQLTRSLAEMISTAPIPLSETAPSDRKWLSMAYQQFQSSYEPAYGGFGGAPKFPRPVALNFLLRYYARTGEQKALEMSLYTLRKMAEGGLHDHIGGGFHRYSVDNDWHVPHFEKMIYDQAQLAIAYLDAYQITHEKFFADVARDIFDYVLRDMTDARGGFYSAEDADSVEDPAYPEHKAEGAFYVWTLEELVRLLGQPTASLVADYYGVRPEGNAPTDPQGEFRGKNILIVSKTLEELAVKYRRTESEIQSVLAEARRKLFTVRAQRPRPHRDDKVLTAWNGLMISAFARGYQILEEPHYLQAAERAASFVMTELFHAKTHTLHRRYRDGEVAIKGYIDDYAFFTQGLLDLYEASFNLKWLEHALELTRKQNETFFDKANGGFFNTAGDDSHILLRMKEDYDGAEPAPSSVAALNLLRLAQMIDREEFQAAAEQTIAAFSQRLQQFPHSLPQMLVAFDFQLDKPRQIILAGHRDADDTRQMLRTIHRRFIPNKVLLLIDADAPSRLAALLPYTKGMTMKQGRATAYVCQNFVCELPTTDPNVVKKQLESTPSR